MIRSIFHREAFALSDNFDPSITESDFATLMLRKWKTRGQNKKKMHIIQCHLLQINTKVKMKKPNKLLEKNVFNEFCNCAFFPTNVSK